MMLTRDGIAGLVCLAIAIWLLLLTRDMPPALLVPIGPAFYPRVVLAILGMLGAMLLASDLIAARRRRTTGATPPAVEAALPRNYLLVLATFVLFGLYILALPELGFRISTFLFAAALQATLDWPRDAKRWALIAVVALATTLICHLVFETYLSVLLPRGRWSGL
jgi:putative tricarboxylic transport membrane protein